MSNVNQSGAPSPGDRSEALSVNPVISPQLEQAIIDGYQSNVTAMAQATQSWQTSFTAGLQSQEQAIESQLAQTTDDGVKAVLESSLTALQDFAQSYLSNQGIRAAIYSQTSDWCNTVNQLLTSFSASSAHKQDATTRSKDQ